MFTTHYACLSFLEHNVHADRTVKEEEFKVILAVAEVNVHFPAARLSSADRLCNLEGEALLLFCGKCSWCNITISQLPSCLLCQYIHSFTLQIQTTLFQH